MPSPSPSATTNNYLQSVSCVSATSCVAVGTYDKPNFAPLGLTEMWDGSSWTVGSAPVGDVNPINYLFSVSCSRTNRCMAVGYQNTVDAMLIEQWNGHQWSVMSIPILAQGFGLNGVSCASVSSCAHTIALTGH